LPTLADEARLLHDGVAALRAGHPARALTLFDAHAALYPAGALVEERAAERALALADLGRTAEARVAAEDFLRGHPASPLAARLRERLRALDGK
jgi:outer membrane protein assembly factor BamD (BamD/ComL family)